MDTDELLLVMAESAGSGLSADRLDRVCEVVAASIGSAATGRSGAAVTIAGATTRAVIGASNEASRQLERAQLTLGFGPCTEATTTGEQVNAPDLLDPAESRWPGLARLLADTGIRAVRAIPLRVGRIRIGSLNIHSDAPHGLDGVNADVLSGAAAVLTVSALTLRPVEGDADLASLENAPVDQAVGMVQATLGVSGGQALTALRDRAFLDGRLLHDVAVDVVAGLVPPDLD